MRGRKNERNRPQGQRKFSVVGTTTIGLTPIREPSLIPHKSVSWFPILHTHTIEVKIQRSLTSRTGDGALTGDRMSGTLTVKPEYCPAHERCRGAFHRRRGALSGVIVGWCLAHPAGLSCRCPPPSPTHQNHRTLKSARPRHISASAAQHPTPRAQMCQPPRAHNHRNNPSRNPKPNKQAKPHTRPSRQTLKVPAVTHT